MKFDEFGCSYGAAYKVVKQDLKNGKDFDNICSKEVLGTDINWFAETQITSLKILKDPFYNKGFPSFDFTQPLGES